jgi:hypothetical protein
MKAAAASLVVLAALAPSALGNVIYSNDFESGVIGPEWSSNTYTSEAPIFTRFNGRYSPGYTELTLAHPNVTTPANGLGDGLTRFRLNFDLYAIDSWDGDAVAEYAPSLMGPDSFRVLVNGDIVFDETLSNMPGASQTMRQPDVGPTHLGYNSTYLDSIYRGISVEFTVPAGEPLVIRWEDSGIEGLTYESWGIDNVTVSVMSVPTPGSIALLLAGVATLRRRR